MGVDAILADPAIDDPRLHHIRFRDFVSNPADCIAAIYDAHEILVRVIPCPSRVHIIGEGNGVHHVVKLWYLVPAFDACAQGCEMQCPIVEDERVAVGQEAGLRRRGQAVTRVIERLVHADESVEHCQNVLVVRTPRSDVGPDAGDDRGQVPR